MKKKGKYLTRKRAGGHFDPPYPKEGDGNWYFRNGFLAGWMLCNKAWLEDKGDEEA